MARRVGPALLAAALGVAVVGALACSPASPAAGSGDGSEPNVDASGVGPSPSETGPVAEGGAAPIADAGTKTTFAPLPPVFTKRLLDLTKYPDARCNDGTAAGYYPAAGAAGASDFVVLLEGGSWCASDAECASRTKDLSSSAAWPETKTPAGILSSELASNPHFAALNRVDVPYCTSDLFSGDAPATGSSKLQFRGRAVLAAIIEDLALTYGFGRAGTSVLLAGASAGGVAVIANADRVAAALPGAKVFALADAGFLPDVPPLVGPSILAQLQTATAYWNGQPDDSCATKNAGAKHKCYLGQYAQPEITTPLFFGQNLEDPHGPLHAGGFTWGATPTTAQIAWMNGVYTPAMTKLLPATTATAGFFSPCQVVHTMVDTAAWSTQAIGASRYDDVVEAFFKGASPTRLEVKPCAYP